MKLLIILTNSNRRFLKRSLRWWFILKAPIPSYTGRLTIPFWPIMARGIAITIFKLFDSSYTLFSLVCQKFIRYVKMQGKALFLSYTHAQALILLFDSRYYL
jgi:hypothetical protein